MGRRLGQLTTVLVLVLAPGTASAAFTGTVDAGTKTVTLTAEGADDVVTVQDNGVDLVHGFSGGFESMTDWDSTLPGVQTVPADSSWRLVINSGGGADSVAVVTARILSVRSDLGSGDDRFQGAVTTPGATHDLIEGGAGHDRIAGGRGNDDVRGGEGNDTLVWNNGDGNDVFSGDDGGSDSVEVNGAPTAGDAFTIRPEGGNVRLDRTNLALFNLVIGPSAERLEVNGLGGNETISGQAGLATSGLTLALDGGTGDDVITGGDGADVLAGGEGADTIAGGGGDDTLVWSNGDGTDVADGNGGFDVMEVEGAPAGGDAFTVGPGGTRTRLDRTNLVPFAIDMAVEVLDLDMLGGNDTATVSDGAGVLVDIDGGSGDDALTGADGNDSLRGGPDADTITGGAGSDAIDGDDGDDTVAARDDRSDLVRCGTGTDSATLDGPSVDGAADCETVDRPAAAPPAVTPPTVAPPAAEPAFVSILTTRVRVTRRRARISLACPAGATTCRGKLALFTARTVRIGRARVVAALGSASFTIPAGQQATVVVKLTRSLPTIAGRSKSLRTRAVAETAASDRAWFSTARQVKLVRNKRW